MPLDVHVYLEYLGEKRDDRAVCPIYKQGVRPLDHPVYPEYLGENRDNRAVCTGLQTGRQTIRPPGVPGIFRGESAKSGD